MPSVRVVLIAMLLVSFVPGTASAELGAIDPVPAATLLLPYFEVELTPFDCVTTLFSVNNASADPAVAHVTLWSEWSEPVIDFDLYLTGYDVQTINLLDIILNGILPRTGPVDSLSPRGAFSSAHSTFGGTCSAAGIPNYAPLSQSFKQLIQESLSGQALSIGPAAGLCTAAPGRENFARGYLTIDSASACSQEFTNDPGYFVAGGLGVANNNNVLWGDYFIVNPIDHLAQGFTLVHLEADDTLACPAPDGTPLTFYCRYAPGGADNREALGSSYAVRFVTGGTFTGGTDRVSYRDPGSIGVPRSCTTGPATVFGQSLITVFDEAENPIVVSTGGPSGEPAPQEQAPFPWEANRTTVGGPLDVGSYLFGWLLLDLGGAQTGDETEKTQAYVVAVMEASGRFSVGLDAIQLDNLTQPVPCRPRFPCGRSRRARE